MENGDRIIGEIKGLDAGVLRVELDYGDGTISLQWLKVARVESSQLFLVQSQDGAVYSGTIGTLEASANRPVESQITKEPAINVPIERATVVKIKETPESFLQRLSGQVNVGAAFGRHFTNTNRMRIFVLGGVIWQSKDYIPATPPVPTQQVYGGVALAEAKVFLFKKTNLTINATVLPALSDLGRVYCNTNASYYFKCFRDFTRTASFYGNWDTRPPPHIVGGEVIARASDRSFISSTNRPKEHPEQA